MFDMYDETRTRHPMLDAGWQGLCLVIAGWLERSDTRQRTETKEKKIRHIGEGGI